jgi:hypothetical protein
MSKLSRAVKRLKGKLKQTKDENAPSTSSASEVAIFQPLQSDPKSSLGAQKKTSSTQLPAQGSHGLNSAPKVTISLGTRLAEPPCEPVLRSTKATPSARKISRLVTEAAVQPKPQPPLIESPERIPHSEPQRELTVCDTALSDTTGGMPEEPGTKEPNIEEAKTEEPKIEELVVEVVHESVIKEASTDVISEELHAEDVPIVPKAPEKVVKQPSSLGKAPAFNARPRPAPKRTVIAPKAKPQPTPKTTPQAPKPTPKWVSTPKPAVQTDAGLYSGFTPSVAQVDQSTPRTLSAAQRMALDILYGDSPAGLASRAYASRSPYSSRPMGSFPTGGALGGGQFSSTGGAFGGGIVTRTGGSFGEGSVFQTGGSLGEAMGVRNSNNFDYKLDKSFDYLVPLHYPDAAQSEHSPWATSSNSTSTSSSLPYHLHDLFPKLGRPLSHYRGGSLLPEDDEYGLYD